MLCGHSAQFQAHWLADLLTVNIIYISQSYQKVKRKANWLHILLYCIYNLTTLLTAQIIQRGMTKMSTK
jgi:hypothetical protein